MTKKILISLMLVAVTCAVYVRVSEHQFVDYDDGLYITDNPRVQSGLTASGIVWAFTTLHAGNWHPLTWLSHMADIQLFGLNPGPHHLMNVLLHAVNTVLLFLLLLRMTGARWRSALVAALFALHPLHVESVAWVAERKDVLSSFFFMVALLLYVRYTESPSRGKFLLTLGAFALGLMAKPMLVTLPLVLLLLDYWPLGRLQSGQIALSRATTFPAPFQASGFRDLILEKVPFLALSTVSGIITILAQQKGGAVSSVETVPITFRMVNALWSYVLYLGKTVWPLNLAVIYPLPSTLTFARGLFASVGLAGISVLAIRSVRKYPWFLVGWLWYLITLLPVIGLIQVGRQSMADRYTYLPLIGVFILMAWSIEIIARKSRAGRNAATTFVVALLIACSALTWMQIGYWKNSVTLFSHAAETIPDNYIAYEGLGRAFAQEGMLDDACSQHEKSLSIEPRYGRALIGMSSVLTREGRLEDALSYAEKALRVSPDSPEAHFNIANVLMKQNRDREALIHYAEGLRHDLDNAKIHFIMGAILGGEGKLDESITHLTEALRINPYYAEAHYALGIALLRQGKFDDSIGHLTEALRLKPDFARARRSLNEAIQLKRRSR
jgi:tetratricopeptide (TPR) repeat protein